MKNLEEKEIKQFSEFEEVTPESSQNLITDKGRFTLGALFNAVIAYAADLINAAVNNAVSGVQALCNAAAEDAAESAAASVEDTISTAASNAAASATAAAQAAKAGAEAAKAAAETAKASAESAKETAVEKAEQTADNADAVASDKAEVSAMKAEIQTLKTSAETAAQVAQAAAFSKLDAPQLWFDGGALCVPDFAGKKLNLPLSLCIEYEVESWEGLGSGDGSGVMFFATRDAEYVTPAVYRGFYLYYHENGQFGFHCGNPRASEESWSTNIFEIRNTAGLPAGRHTLVACIGGEISAGKPTHYALYLDGVEIAATVISQSLASADITSARVLSIGQAANYSNPFYAGGAKIPIKLSRAQMFNFLIDDTGSPYAVSDYVGGKPVPPTLLRSSIFGDKNYNIYFRTNSNSNYDASANVLTVFQAAGVAATQSSLQFKVDFPVPIAAGKTVKITYDSITGDAVQNASGAYANISFRNSSDQYPLGDVQLTSLNGGTILKTQVAAYSSYKLDIVCVYANTTESSESDQTIKINGLRIEVDGAVLYLDGSADGLQARDLSACGNHAWLYGNVRGGRPRAVGQSNWKLSWAAGGATGAYCGQNSAALALPEFSFSRVFVSSNNAATFQVGDASNAATYAAELSVPASGWAELDITTSAASALTFKPTSAVSAATTLTIIIDHRRTY